MAQTQNYVFTSGRGLAGQKADLSSCTLDSFAAEGAVTFGQAVKRGTDPEKQCAAFDGGTILGVALFSQATEVPEVAGYQDKETVPVMTEGRVIVDLLAVSVTAGETAYVVDATGVYTNVATAATAIGTFLTTGDGLQVLELSL